MTVTEITSATHGCGRTVDCLVMVPANLSHTGKAYWANKSIDYCLAPLVKTLNAFGVDTAACCCGHGEAPGSIILHDGTCIQLRTCLMTRRRMTC